VENPRVPEHQKTVDDWYERGDSGGYFPTAESADEYQKLVAEQEYHLVRHQCLHNLIERSTNLFGQGSAGTRTVLDFGVGDGSVLKALKLAAKRVYGIDTSDHMIKLAESQFSEREFLGLVGGAERLTDIDDSIDTVVCLNTLGYLDETETQTFWAGIQRLVTPGGYLILMTGNSLFDLFALNSGTADFFRTEFLVDDADSLLSRGREPRFINARRHNPLKFPEELRARGFNHLDTGFCMWHKLPPELLIQRDRLSLREARWLARDFLIHDSMISPEDKWQLYFRCSVFAVVAVRDDSLA
jgi:ubiquinone/menaquinone biosynthesis C-methylase UbiE